MSESRILFLACLTIIFISNVLTQDISITVIVHNHKTYAPLDSALVTVLRDGIIITSSYTGVDGKAHLTFTPTGVEVIKSELPNTFVVSENYPNPFTDETRVDFSIPESQTVRADVYNILGQRVMSEALTLSAGYYTMNLSLPHLSTGVYFLRFRGMEQQAIKLMKVGDNLLFTGGVSDRGSIQVTTSRGVTALSLPKATEAGGEFTIQIQKERYEAWSVTEQIESDTQLTVPLVLLAEHLLTDIDGNVYQTVQIGNQWWMAENLRVTRYRNGDAIPTNLDFNQWKNTTSGAYAIYPHSNAAGIDSDAEMVSAYGKLYNWYAVDDSRGLCPDGWRLPSDTEWTTLTNYLGGSGVAGGKMKSTRTHPHQHPRWNNPNIGATNESGFSGLPGGYRGNSGFYSYVGVAGYWWSSMESNSHSAWYRDLIRLDGYVFRNAYYKLYGFSVRCLRDF